MMAFLLVRRAYIARQLAIIFVISVLAVLPRAACAQNATWLANPGSGDFNSNANWNPTTVPTGIAFFDTSSVTSLTFTANTTIGGWTFNAGASAYSFVTSFNLAFTGVGITINGGSVQISTVGAGSIDFYNSSTAGSASLINVNNDRIYFHDSSTAGSASITNNWDLAFYDNSTAGNANIINNSGLKFFNFSSAGGATITTNNASDTFIADSASGGSARFIFNGTGLLDISLLTIGGTTAGSIEGTGGIYLGSKNLTVGGNNLSTTYSGIIQDGGVGGGLGGSLTKVGTGTLMLSDINIYTGSTNVNGGTLWVDGSIATSSLTSVNSGGTLVGIGTVGNTSVNSGGIFAPGTPGVPGTAMAVAGNLTFQNGATYLVQLDPSTATLANITGSATLAGQVLAAFAPGSYMVRQYTILHASSLIGTFDSSAFVNAPGFTASLSYTPTDVLLNLKAALGMGGGLGGNQQSVSNALNDFFNNGGTLPPNFLAIFGLAGGNLATALSQLSGEAATDAQQSAFQLMNQFLGVMIDPFVTGRSGSGGGGALGFAPEQQAALPPDVALAYASVLKAPPKKPTFERRWSAWGAAYGGANRTDGDPAGVGSNNFTARTYGFAGGMDYHFTPDVLAGFAVAGGGTNWSLAQNLGGGRSDAFQAGIYAVARSGPAYVSAALAFTNYWMSTDRFAFAGDHLDASFNAQSYGGRLEAGYRFAAPWIAVTPYAAVQAVNFHTPSYSERDLTGGGFALSFASRNATDTRGELGARFDHLLSVGNGMPLTLRARVAWAHDWVSDPSLLATFQALPGASFIVNGAAPARDSLLASAGSELHLTPAFSLAAKFDGEFASDSQTYGGIGTLRYIY